ncbi:ribosomal-protein-serine acetyltransferase [Abditibacteriota bacterium]|nr:ribosomal-protein-serine acetyltransferase [Abditibacteriota bacterium]
MNLHALDLPFGLELETPRLLLCAPRDDEEIGPEINAVICASWSELRVWMPWAKILPTQEDSQMHARQTKWKWNNRSEFEFALRLRSSRRLIGRCGMHTIDPNVGRAEIGYWIDSRWSGYGLMNEAVARLIAFADEIGFQRLEIRCDARNQRSSNIARRLGFEREGTLRRVRFDNQDRLCDMEVWARLR